MRSVTGLTWPLPKLLCLGQPDKYLSLTFKQFYPRFLRYKHSNSSKSTSPYFYIGGFVAVYLSKMAATMVGPISKCYFHASLITDQFSWQKRQSSFLNSYGDIEKLAKVTKSNQAFCLSQCYTTPFGLNPSIYARDKVAISCFWSKYDFLNIYVTLKRRRVRLWSPKPNHL